MIEGLFIEADHFEFPTVVLAVAREAILRLDVLARVITLLLRDQGLDLLVAFQALGIGHFVPKVMALGAIAHAFQRGMGSGKVTGR
jgi:hypothetical protein